MYILYASIVAALLLILIYKWHVGYKKRKYQEVVDALRNQRGTPKSIKISALGQSFRKILNTYTHNYIDCSPSNHVYITHISDNLYMSPRVLRSLNEPTLRLYYFEAILTENGWILNSRRDYIDYFLVYSVLPSAYQNSNPIYSGECGKYTYHIVKPRKRTSSVYPEYEELYMSINTQLYVSELIDSVSSSECYATPSTHYSGNGGTFGGGGSSASWHDNERSSHTSSVTYDSVSSSSYSSSDSSSSSSYSSSDSVSSSSDSSSSSSSSSDW